MDIRELITGNERLMITYSAMMIAFVFLTTVVFNLYIPATQGFFNIGETGVYLAAITGGPIVGMIGGGVGSMLADLFLGYGVYAPATLVVKGLEGFIVGYLAIVFEEYMRKRGRYIGILIGISTGLAILVIGNTYLQSSDTTITLFNGLFTIDIATLVWDILGIAVIAMTLILGIKYPYFLGDIIAMIAGGVEMILGYFLYERYLFGYEAYLEVPYNIMQMIAGTVITIVLITALRAYYGEK